MQGLKNYGVQVPLGIMRGMSMDVAFGLKNKETGAIYDLTGKSVFLNIFYDLAGVETELLEIEATIDTPTSGRGLFPLTPTHTNQLLVGVEYWYRATVVAGSHIDPFAWGAITPEDGRPA